MTKTTYISPTVKFLTRVIEQTPDNSYLGLQLNWTIFTLTDQQLDNLTDPTEISENKKRLALQEFTVDNFKNLDYIYPPEDFAGSRFGKRQLTDLAARGGHVTAAVVGGVLVFRHAGVIVPGLVVFAHMVEAEPVIFVQAVAALGRAVMPRLGTAGLLAEPFRRFLASGLVYALRSAHLMIIVLVAVPFKHARVDESPPADNIGHIPIATQPVGTFIQ